MRRSAGLGLGALLSLSACSGGDAGGSDVSGTDYTFECDVSDPYDLPDPTLGMVGHEHDCDGTPFFDEVSGATSYYVGEFHFDDCGNLKGTEAWYLYANPTWIENGGEDCVVVWDLDGTTGDRVNKGDYSVDFAATVNLSATTCDEVDGGYSDGDELYAGSETFSMTYDVQVDGDRSQVFWANGGVYDQDLLGEGGANGNHATYLSGNSCPFF